MISLRVLYVTLSLGEKRINCVSGARTSPRLKASHKSRIDHGSRTSPRLRTGPRAKTSSSNTQSMEGTSVQHLPGSTPRHYKPHPPNTMAPPRVCTHLIHLQKASFDETDCFVVTDKPPTTGVANDDDSADLNELSYAPHSADSLSNSADQLWRRISGEQAHTNQHKIPFFPKINSYISFYACSNGGKCFFFFFFLCMRWGGGGGGGGGGMGVWK